MNNTENDTQKVTSINTGIVEYNKNMSLVLSIEGKDCLVSVADSRMTTGEVNIAFASKDIAVKIQKMTDVIISIVGSAEYGNSLIDQCLTRIQGKKMYLKLSKK